MKVLKNFLAILLACALIFTAQDVFAFTTSPLRPIGNGAYTNFAGAGGWWFMADYTRVDEITCNGTYDYVYATSTGMKESFVVTSTTAFASSTITKIEIVPCASRIETGGMFAKLSKMNVFYRINGVDYSSTSGDYWLPNTSTPQLLATSTYANINYYVTSTANIEVGVEYQQCGFFGCAGVRLSNISAIIYYE
ncbi:hypothetical protein KKG46_04590 [Patescibacteria group bacterium]|nr:hypothetical protein [Patescibacteria group bacterium]